MRHQRGGPSSARRRRPWLFLPALALACLPGCQRPDLHPAESLAAAEGHADEAIAAYEAVCDAFPKHADCVTAQQRLAGLHARAADELMGKGQFLAADQRLLLALALASDAERPDLAQRRQSPRLLTGLRLERACRFAPPLEAFNTLTELSQDGSPVAAPARQCLDRERRRLLLARVERACSPSPEESCVALLPLVTQLTPPDDPSIRNAVAAVTQEQKRLAPLLKRLEGQLKTLATLAHQYRAAEDRIENCMSTLGSDGEVHGHASEMRDQCEARSGGAPDYDPVSALQGLVDRGIDEIIDPSLRASLEARLADAMNGTYTPAPPAAAPRP